MSKLRITWKKSGIGYARDQRVTLRTLGLRRLQQTVEHADNPSIRGMLAKVRHMVHVEEIVKSSKRASPRERAAKASD